MKRSPGSIAEVPPLRLTGAAGDGLWLGEMLGGSRDGLRDGAATMRDSLTQGLYDPPAACTCAEEQLCLSLSRPAPSEEAPCKGGKSPKPQAGKGREESPEPFLKLSHY